MNFFWAGQDGSSRYRITSYNVCYTKLLRLLLGASLAIGILISVTGPIGFVGLVVPHVVRRLYRQSIPKLLLPTALLGGLFLIAADLAARLLGGVSGEIPIGIITALLGAPFFVFLVLRRGRITSYNVCYTKLLRQSYPYWQILSCV